MLKLEYVLLVDGLYSTLITIYQLCDWNIFVNFAKNKCVVMDTTSNCVMEEESSSENYYLLTHSTKCYTT